MTYKYKYYQNTHTLQNKLKQTHYNIHPNEIVTYNQVLQCKVTLMYMALLSPRT